MARTPEEIEAEISQSIALSDPTIDTVTGPVPNYVSRPVAGVLSVSSQEAEDLRKLFTVNFPESITVDESRLALGNFGSSPGVGTKSSHIQYFMRFTRPTSDITIDPGSIVGNDDGSITYSVQSKGTITATGADAFYNAARQAYEIGLLVEATGTGSQYELSPFRVNKVLTNIPGIDATENRTKSSTSTPEETVEQQANRLRKALTGLNQGGPGGLSKRITDALQTIVTDVSVVQPFNVEFARYVEGPALDIYLIGNQTKTFTETFTATAGQTQFVLTKKPVQSIITATVNSVSGVVNFTLVSDTTFETGNSLVANDVAVAGTPLIAGDVVEIQYEYNSALEQANNVVFNGSDSYLFNTDILLRSPFVVNPVITGEIKILSSYDPVEVETSLANFVATELSFMTFSSIYSPKTFSDNMKVNVPGIQTLRLTEFRRNTGSVTDIEAIVLSKRENLYYDSSKVTIRVIK